MAIQNVSTKRAGPGIQEGQLHPSTGLRVAHQSLTLIHDPFLIVSNAAGTGGIAIENQTAWTVVASNVGALDIGFKGAGSVSEMPYPCTPVIGLTNTLATNAEIGQVIQVRLTGINQFGDAIVEITPTITIVDNATTDLASTPNTHLIFMSKVFARVDKMEFKASVLTATENFLSLGVSWGGFSIETTGFALGTTTEEIMGQSWLNFGVGTPVKCRQHRVNFDTAGALVTLLRDAGSRDIMTLALNEATQTRTAAGVGCAIRTVESSGAQNSGFTIGQSDSALSWQGDPNKWGFINTAFVSGGNAMTQLLRSAPLGGVVAWDPVYKDEIDVDAAFYTSIQLNNQYTISGYGNLGTLT